MANDLRLLKAILQTIDIAENDVFVGLFDFGDEYTSHQVTYHLDLMLRAGLITLTSVVTGDSSNLGYRLTCEGNDYLDILYTCLD